MVLIQIGSISASSVVGTANSFLYALFSLLGIFALRVDIVKQSAKGFEI